MRTLSFFLLAAIAAGPAWAADPLLSSWKTANSNRYARVYQGSNSAPLATWPTGVTGMVFGGQSEPAYSDVQRITYSPSNVYVDASGLASYTMGPWYNNAAKTILFQNWPADQGLEIRIPRNPTVATTKTRTRMGPIALAVNGVVFYNGQDAFSYSASSGTDLMAPQGDGYWNRDALLNEAVTFDPGLAHQQNAGQYHYHVNPIALRYQLGDHVTASGNSYTEAASAPAHSPILGWAWDGFPIYGPYGYASPMDSTSGVRRMVSGFVKREGSNGTVNLAATGRTTLPAWAAAAQGRSSTTLATAQYAPNVSTARPLGYYQEDNDYLGDHGYIQGKDFDLNVSNARYCLTPEYPDGTWAYFVAIDASGAPVFPYTVGPQYLGTASGGQVQGSIEAVTEFARGGAATPIAVTATSTGASVLLGWTSVEGGSYQIETSSDGNTWTTAATNLASAGSATTYTVAATSGYFRVTLTALAVYDESGSGDVTAIGANGAAQLPGASGTAYLLNLSAQAEVGGVAGSPTAGFSISGSGTKTFLVRAVGPTLQNFGVTGFLADPSLQLYTGATVLGANDNWASSLSSVFSAAFAFPLAAGSKDAALAAILGPGTYTMPASSADGSSGVALLEVYDAAPASSPRLVNLSARGYVGSGGNLVAGFVVGGVGTAQLLLRGVGPSLVTLGLADTLADPALTLYQGSSVLATNDNWGANANAAAIAAAASQVGAFSLLSGSKDASLLVTLTPGAYTVSLTAADNGTGTAVVEVYQVN